MQHCPLQAPAIPDGASDSGGVPLWAGFGPSAAGGAARTPGRSGAGSLPPPADDAGSDSGGGVLDGFFAQVSTIKVRLWALRSLWCVGMYRVTNREGLAAPVWQQLGEQCVHLWCCTGAARLTLPAASAPCTGQVVDLP